MNDDRKFRLDLPDELFTVRGRPVAYFRNAWGGELRVTERGYFPVSSTGYRSLCCGLNTPPPTQLQLDRLAEDLDRENLSRLRACSQALASARGDALSRYVHVSGAAHNAVAHGFFATDAIRLELWRHAYRLYAVIADDPRFQPAPSSPRGPWNPQHCADTITAARAAVPWLARLLAGDIAEFSGEPTGYLVHFYGLRTYLELPPRPTPEPVGTVPALAQDFGFAADLDAGGPAADEEEEPEIPEDDDEREMMPEPPAEDADSGPSPTLPDSAGTPEPAQLSLF